jgi:hypothetical protein
MVLKRIIIRIMIIVATMEKIHLILEMLLMIPGDALEMIAWLTAMIIVPRKARTDEGEHRSCCSIHSPLSLPPRRSFSHGGGNDANYLFGGGLRKSR